LIQTAKADGIINAVAQHTHYGFSNHGPIREHGSEIADPHLTICVELVGERDQLDLFCRRHGDLLADKVTSTSNWNIGRSHSSISNNRADCEAGAHLIVPDHPRPLSRLAQRRIV
jgi:hypothetical protein